MFSTVLPFFFISRLFREDRIWKTKDYKKEKCIHVSTRSSPRSYLVSLWRFYSLPLSQFSYSRLFADGKVSNPTRRRRKMYANHSATIWLTRLCCFFLGEKKENGFLSKKTNCRLSMDRFVFPLLAKTNIMSNFSGGIERGGEGKA